MSTALASQPTVGAVEQALIMGDLSGLSGEHKVVYYNRVCASLGLNPMTKPFQYIVLNEKLTLYATKDCTEQLRTIHGISLKIVAREVIENVYVVTTQATRSDGRTDEATGAVPLVKEEGEWTTSQSGKRFFKKTGNFIPLDPEARAFALMKAETKSKRRVTLSICGLGILDESEADTIPGATIVPTAIDTGTAQIGTQEAADYVAQQKIKQLEEGKSKNFEMLRAFREVKKRIGTDEYYRILGTQGYKHANEITEEATGREIYRQMKAIAGGLRQVGEILGGRQGDEPQKGGPLPTEHADPSPPAFGAWGDDTTGGWSCLSNNAGVVFGHVELRAGVWYGYVEGVSKPVASRDDKQSAQRAVERAVEQLAKEATPLADPNGGTVTQQQTEPSEERSDAKELTAEEHRAALSASLRREQEEAAKLKFGEKPTARRR